MVDADNYRLQNELPGNLLRFLDDPILSRPTTVLSERSARQ